MSGAAALAETRVAVEAEQFHRAVIELTLPDNDPAYRSRAFKTVLATVQTQPELVMPQDLARLASCHSFAGETAAGRQSGNLLGLILQQAQAEPKRSPSLLVYHGLLRAEQTPAVLDMGGHVQMVLGVPTAEATAQMVKIPQLRPVHGSFKLFSSPLGFTRFLLREGALNDRRFVLPAALGLLQQAEALHAADGPRFRQVGTMLRQAVKELTNPLNHKTVKAAARYWPQAIERMVFAPQ